MPQYLNQTEAASYDDTIATWPNGQAVAYLTAASNMVDNYCQRTFDVADVTPDLKMAVAFLATYLKTTNHATGTLTSEKIGDYSASYQPTGSNLPEMVETILQPYRRFVIG